MISNRMKWGPSLLLVVALLAGCATSLPKIEPEKLPQPPAAFKEGDGRWTQAAPAEAQPRGEWWKAFADPVLDDLVERANRSNTSIQVAAARLAQARAIEREHVLALELDLAGGGLDQPEDAAAGRGLAASRLPDEAERFAGVDREADTVHGSND